MKNSILILLLSMYGNSFAKDLIPKNIFSIESGIYDRGIVALSYTKNFNHRSKMFCSIESAIGFPSTELFIPNYYVIAPTVNFGNQNKYFTIGFANKLMYKAVYYVTDEGWGFPFFDNISYTGYAYAPFLGYNYVGRKRLNFKFRLSITCLTKNYATQITYNPKRLNVLPGLGVSIGIGGKKQCITSPKK